MDYSPEYKEDFSLDLMFLTQVGGILKPFAWIFGIIMNAIYEFISLMNIHSIAVCVIIFTFVAKMLMLPLTIKQQKSTKLSSRMNPEIMKINEKYKGKKDETSMRKQQAELQAVYEKYGSTPMSGCLPMLISLPIMFALYRVIYAIPAYVNDIYEMYGIIADKIQGIQGYGQAILSFIQENKISVSNLTPFIDVISDGGIAYNTIEITKNNLVDLMYQFNTDNWELFRDTSTWLAAVDPAKIIQNFSLNVSSESLRPVDTAAFAAMIPGIESTIREIVSVNSFLGNLNILNSPGWSFPGIIIPILAAVTQFVQSKVAMAGNSQQNNVDNPAAASMKMMNYVMPIMSMFFCAMLPICVGLYWVASAVFGAIQTVFINRYMDKVDVDDLIAANAEKVAKKKAKQGVVTGSRMAEVAKTSTKSIQNEETRKFSNAYDYKNNPSGKSVKGEYKRSDVSYSAKSISANANLLRKNYDKQSGAENNEEKK